MLSRTTITFLTGGACGALLATLLQGPVVPASVLSDGAASAPVEEATRAIRRDAQPTRSDAPSADTEPTVEALQALVDELETELHRARHGVPTVWDFEPPQGYGPDDFEATVQEILGDCAAEDGTPLASVDDIVAFDCSEPPCAAFVRGHAERPDGCDGWTARFGEWTSRGGGEITCADGSTATYSHIGPSLEDAMMGLSHAPAAERINARKAEDAWSIPTVVTAPDDNRFRRMDWRAAQHAAALCAD